MRVEVGGDKVVKTQCMNQLCCIATGALVLSAAVAYRPMHYMHSEIPIPDGLVQEGLGSAADARWWLEIAHGIIFALALSSQQKMKILVHVVTYF